MPGWEGGGARAPGILMNCDFQIVASNIMGKNYNKNLLICLEPSPHSKMCSGFSVVFSMHIARNNFSQIRSGVDRRFFDKNLANIIEFFHTFERT